jgi:hypothetical protein
VRFFFEEGIVEPHIRSRTRSLSKDILNQTPSTPTAP